MIDYVLPSATSFLDGLETLSFRYCFSQMFQSVVSYVDIVDTEVTRLENQPSRVNRL